jgi:hypothetical protein
MLVASVVMGFLALFVPRVLRQTYESFGINQSKLECQRDARDSIQQIEKDLNQARGASVRVSSPVGQPAFSRIVFQTVDGTTTTIRQDGRLLKVDRGGGERTVTDRLVAVSFLLSEKGQKRSVHLSLVLGKAPDRRRQYTYAALVRNIVFMN